MYYVADQTSKQEQIADPKAEQADTPVADEEQPVITSDMIDIERVHEYLR